MAKTSWPVCAANGCARIRTAPETPLIASLRVEAPRGSRRRLRELREDFRRAGWVPADRSPYAEAVVSAFEPIRTRTLELLDDPAELDRLLALNASRAEEIADATLTRVYDALGFLPRA